MVDLLGQWGETKIWKILVFYVMDMGERRARIGFHQASVLSAKSFCETFPSTMKESKEIAFA